MSNKLYSRRAVLKGLLGTMAVTLLAACSAPATSGEQTTTEPAATSAQANPLDSLQAGQGAVIELDGQQVAVYKDEAGQVVKLSPVCPHQGCTVAWNAQEGTWDCPCHASRFEADGTRISGPATSGLEAVG